MSVEFRVRWRREGRQPSYQIYQSWSAALAKVRRILALEEIKGESDFATMPDLAEPPMIQTRQVGEWGDMDDQPPVTVTESARADVRFWACRTAPEEQRDDVPF